MIKICHVSPARALRILWLMEEPGGLYEVETICFPPDEAFLAVSPTGTLPTIAPGIRARGSEIARA